MALFDSLFLDEIETNGNAQLLEALVDHHDVVSSWHGMGDVSIRFIECEI
jgi:hypothetical protein